MHTKIRRFFPALFALTALAVLGGCAGAHDPFASGNANAQATDMPKAVAEKIAEPPELSILKGEAFLAERKFTDARAKFAHALQEQPKNDRARLGLAEALLGLHQLADALAGFESVMDSEPLQAKALQGRGITLSLMGQESLALPLLRQAVTKDPSLWRAWNAIGRDQAIAGDATQALASYDRALLSNPQSAAVHNNRGMALMMAKRYDQAEVAFRSALAIDHKLKAAEMNLRLALAWQGKYEEALAGLKRGEAPEAFNNIGFVAMERGDFSKAKMFFTKAMEISPSYYPTAANNLDYLEQQTKKVAAAPAATGAQAAAVALQD